MEKTNSTISEGVWSDQSPDNCWWCQGVFWWDHFEDVHPLGPQNSTSRYTYHMKTQKCSPKDKCDYTENSIVCKSTKLEMTQMCSSCRMDKCIVVYSQDGHYEPWKRKRIWPMPQPIQISQMEFKQIMSEDRHKRAYTVWFYLFKLRKQAIHGVWRGWEGDLEGPWGGLLRRRQWSVSWFGCEQLEYLLCENSPSWNDSWTLYMYVILP